MTASRRPGSSTARSTARASGSTSSGSWCRRSAPATSSSWTTSARTRAPRSGAPSAPSVAALPAAEVLPRPQPDREALRQAQALAPQGRSPHPGRRLRRDRPHPRHHHRKRVQQLPYRGRLCPSLNSSRSRTSRSAPPPIIGSAVGGRIRSGPYGDQARRIRVRVVRRLSMSPRSHCASGRGV